MTNAIIIIILLCIIAVAVRSSLKHFKGEDGCCGGGGGYEAKKKDIPVKQLSDTPIGKKRIKISGMHCGNCVLSVTKAINKLDGASAEVNLKRKCATVSYDRAVSDADLKRAVESVGFEVLEIKEL